jgi:plastocyanin
MVEVARDKKAVSSAGVVIVVLLIVLAGMAVVYVNQAQGTSDKIAQLNTEIAQLSAQIAQLNTEGSQLTSNQQHLNSSVFALKHLPVMNQAPTTRTVRETWYLTSPHQDRFDPSVIVVNQGDTIQLTLVDNDTVAHDFVMGPPYNIIVNATEPGMLNDLTQQTFTTAATNNSPGVVVKGSPGGVLATYSFVASYSGVFEFVCTYHVATGMIGYLVVLPNAGYSATTSTT